MATAYASHYLFHLPILTFFASAAALIFLSKVLGDATEHLSDHLGGQLAGLINVTLSNLAELIIIYVAVSKNMIDLVQAGIAGSIMGNLLLVMGMSIYVGCRKNGLLTYNQAMAWLQLKMLFLVCATLFLPTLFNEHISEVGQVDLSYILALMLPCAYVYFYRLSMTDKRFKEVREQSEKMDGTWSTGFSFFVIILAGIGAFLMSELLVGEVESVAPSLGLSTGFVGFILIPILGNIAEHFVAVVAARKGMTELSLSIAVGSASQVGMVVAPAAVLFGVICGNPVTLHFAGLPLGAVIATFFATLLVLHDDKWEISEGVMLLALYFAIMVCFLFTS
ncbi:MAG: Ca2+:H+ antiporter [Parcubacteria group bacterium Gr01-1014_20]|nr:MAG: Ca2+:H+ antiporter [Parcubacteria group bacterium Gr01-1014_20]